MHLYGRYLSKILPIGRTTGYCYKWVLLSLLVLECRKLECKEYTSTGIVGLLGAGIMAMAGLSLNTTSVIFANEIVKPLIDKTYPMV